jgi:hypothetical protein
MKTKQKTNGGTDNRYYIDHDGTQLLRTSTGAYPSESFFHVFFIVCYRTCVFCKMNVVWRLAKCRWWFAFSLGKE